MQQYIVATVAECVVSLRHLAEWLVQWHAHPHVIISVLLRRLFVLGTLSSAPASGEGKRKDHRFLI